MPAAAAKSSTQAPAKPAAGVPTAPGKSAPQNAKVTPLPAKPAAQAPKTSAKGGAPATKQATKSAAKPAANPADKGTAQAALRKPEKAAGEKPEAPESELKLARRDPFESLIGRQLNKAPANLPPGKAGLQVSTLRLDGIVKAPNGMIAVVSNPQARTYFLREGDHLYDGTVEKISMDGVSFHEEGKDAFGKPVERQVNKRIYSSPGEQQ